MIYNDGIYFEIYVIKDGIRYNMQTISLKDMTKILIDSLIDGLEIAVAPEKGGEQK